MNKTREQLFHEFTDTKAPGTVVNARNFSDFLIAERNKAAADARRAALIDFRPWITRQYDANRKQWQESADPQAREYGKVATVECATILGYLDEMLIVKPAASEYTITPAGPATVTLPAEYFEWLRQRNKPADPIGGAMEEAG